MFRIAGDEKSVMVRFGSGRRFMLLGGNGLKRTVAMRFEAERKIELQTRKGRDFK